MVEARHDAKNPHLILVVDDDDLMKTFYRTLFKKHSSEFTAHIVTSAAAALDHLKSAPVDAMILDWDMPGLSGIDLLKALRRAPTTQSLKVMVVSGRARAESEVRAFDSGADDYLAKPFHVEVLIARLRRLVRR